MADQGGAQRSVDAPPESVPQAPQVIARRRSHWYGWQMLATDGAAAALLAGGIATWSGGVVAFGTATFAFGGPIVHLAHGRGDTAAESLGIRVGFAATGLIVGAMMQDCSHSASESCGLEGGAIGLLAGAGVAMLIDTVFMAHEDVRREQVPRNAHVLVSPAVSVSKSSGTVGLAGTF